VTEGLSAILARNVKRARNRLGISQDELAHRSGLHRTYIGGIERAERNISLKSLEKIAAALGLTPAELLNPGSRADG
jgi:transcriptional regulator with XRE-family HTH domain